MRPSVVLLAAFASGFVFANDGGITFGGTPRLLDGHPSVSMESEAIHMTINGDKIVSVDCTFVFKNSGPGKAGAQGSILHFSRTNWRPTEKDDIDIFWGYRSAKG